jgi:hypothetical protein
LASASSVVPKLYQGRDVEPSGDHGRREAREELGHAGAERLEHGITGGEIHCDDPDAT